MCYSKIKFSCLIHHHTMQKAAAKVRISEQKTKEIEKNNSHESIFFTLLSSLFTFFRTFARDKSIK